MTTPFDTVREALAAIADTHVHTYKQALAALAEIKRQHFTPEDMADAYAQGFRDGVASVTAGQEPFAHYVYFPDQQRGEFAHDLDKLCEDMTNDENHEVTALYTAAPVAQQQYDHVAVTWDAARTRILAVTLQDAEGRVLCVIDEAPAQQPQIVGEVLPRWDTEKERVDGVRAHMHKELPIDTKLYAYLPAESKPLFPSGAPEAIEKARNLGMDLS